MGAWARKKSQEVPIQGVIVNDETMESETDKTLSINAIKRLTHGNSIIVNGDFQINQRGESEYPSGAVKYTVDMWRRMGCAVTVEDNGITLNTVGNSANGAYGQKVESLEAGKKYTVCINITSLSGTGEVSIGSRTDFDNVGHSNRLKQGVNKITFTATGKWLTVCCKGVLITIEYIDLFEGTIAYPHVKEDYAIALLRCQRYFKIFHNISIRMLNRNSAYNYYVFVLENNMRTNGTVTVSTDSYIHGVYEETLYGAPLSDFIAEYHYGRVIFRKKRNTSDNTTDSVLSIGILAISAEPF